MYAMTTSGSLLALLVGFSLLFRLLFSKVNAPQAVSNDPLLPVYLLRLVCSLNVREDHKGQCLSTVHHCSSLPKSSQPIEVKVDVNVSSDRICR